MELEEDQLNEIVQKVKPGARVAARKQVDTIPGLDAPTDMADIDAIDVVELRRKYFRRSGVADPDDGLDAADDGEDADAPAGLDDDDEDDDLAVNDLDDPQEQMVDMEYEEAGTKRTKTVIVDTGSEEVIGEQG